MAKVRQIRHENSTLYFVADDQGTPWSPGYLDRATAERVLADGEASDWQAPAPAGVDVEKILKDYR